MHKNTLLCDEYLFKIYLLRLHIEKVIYSKNYL